MRAYLLRSRVLGKVLKLIKPSALPRNTSGDRCLKLSALRFLRAVLSVDEDLYHRHIIHDDLFAPVFEAFRANPVGDNLVSSSIVEMIDFINTKNMHSLIEYIVTKHLSATGVQAPVPSLEDVSSPYVSTLTCLRHAYETRVQEQRTKDQSRGGGENMGIVNTVLSRVGRVVTNEKALEDQRKFRESDQMESYFDCDDDDDDCDIEEVDGSRRGNSIDPSTVINSLPATPRAGGLQQQQLTTEMHKTPRMFSLSQADITSENSELSSDRPRL